MFTRVAVDHIYNLGRTFRLLLDGFGNKMLPDVGWVWDARAQSADPTGDHLTRLAREWPDSDIEREGSKIAEMARKMRQGYKEVVSCARRVIRSFPLTSRQLHPSSRTICYSTRTRECSWSELTTSHEKV